MSPRPRTRVPSLTTATMFPLFVCSYTFAGFAWISLQTSATPGVYQMAKSSKSRMQHFGEVSSFPL